MARLSSDVCETSGEMPGLAQQVGAALGLGEALLVEVDVDPAGEQVLRVPFAVPVAQQDERVGHGRRTEPYRRSTRPWMLTCSAWT